MDVRNRRRGFSLVELLVVIGIILIIIGIAVPYYSSAQFAAREMATKKEIQNIQQAEQSYLSAAGRFAGRLEDLKEFIPAPLVSGQTKSGYAYDLKIAQDGYEIHAHPQIFGTTGHKTFLADQSMSIWEHLGPEPATTQDKEISAVTQAKK